MFPFSRTGQVASRRLRSCTLVPSRRRLPAATPSLRWADSPAATARTRLLRTTTWTHCPSPRWDSSHSRVPRDLPGAVVSIIPTGTSELSFVSVDSVFRSQSLPEVTVTVTLLPSSRNSLVSPTSLLSELEIYCELKRYCISHCYGTLFGCRTIAL